MNENEIIVAKEIRKEDAGSKKKNFEQNILDDSEARGEESGESVDEDEDSDSNESIFFQEEELVRALDGYFLKNGIGEHIERDYRHKLYKKLIEKDVHYFGTLGRKLCKKRSKGGEKKGGFGDLMGLADVRLPKFLNALLSDHEKISGLLERASQEIEKITKQADTESMRADNATGRADQEFLNRNKFITQGCLMQVFGYCVIGVVYFGLKVIDKVWK